MRLKLDGNRISAFDGEDLLATIVIDRVFSEGNPKGVIVATDLEGGTDARMLMLGLRAIRQLAKEEPVYFGVRKDHPRHDQLVRIWKRAGAKEEFTMLRFGGEE